MQKQEIIGITRIFLMMASIVPPYDVLLCLYFELNIENMHIIFYCAAVFYLH